MSRRRSWNRDWRFRERVSENRTYLAVAAALIALIAAIFFPRYSHAVQYGPECSSLPAPLGGNNRSVLALAGHDQQNLQVELKLINSTITMGQPLKIDIVFNNKDIGPVILYLQEGNPITVLVPWQPAQAPGLTFEIVGVGASPQRVNQSLPVVTGSWENPRVLHLLGSRTRCTIHYEFTAAFLQQLGLTTGKWRITATYRNNNPGGHQDLSGGLPTPTATPAYTDQGIWVGETFSNEAILTVQ